MKFKSLISVVFVLLFIGCKCEDICCPELKMAFRSMLPYEVGDSLVFVNDHNERLVFQINKKEYSESKVLNCDSRGLGCGCSDAERDCETNGLYWGETTDTTRKLVDTSYQRKRIYYNQYLEVVVRGVELANLSIRLIDYSVSFAIDPLNAQNDEYRNQVLFDELEIGGKIYTDVIEDTRIVSPNYTYPVYVSKVYANSEIGLIAFYDEKTSSLFYLK